MNVADLDHLKSRLDARRPLDPAIVRNLRDDLIVRWTYHSNAIEGNSLTLRETKVVLEGVTVGGKRMTDHLEAINHRDAILMLEELVQKRDPLNEWQIQSLHQLILRGIDNDHAGVYRTVNVRISGAEHTPPEALRVPEFMEAFIGWLQTEGENLHPVIRAARIHSDFVKIHPFTDGNGRTARLLMNLDLLKSGWPPVILPVESRLPYYEALDAHHVQGDFAPFMELMIRLVKDSFQPYWFALGVDEPTGA